MENSKIRWTTHSWNFFTGCTEVSPGCDHCYARTIAEKFHKGFPNGFEPTYKPHRLSEPEKWSPARVFVNSMSDCFHRAFTDEQISAGFDVMTGVDWHQYQVLTKRPERMIAFVERWLKKTGRKSVPEHIWLGVSIESDEFCYRADVLRKVRVPVRFISAEPLLSPLPSLDLKGVAWLIVGGESGPGFRSMDHAWARELLAKARAAGTAFYFKQSSAYRTEMGIELDGIRYEEFPRPAPEGRRPRGSSGPRSLPLLS